MADTEDGSVPFSLTPEEAEAVGWALEHSAKFARDLAARLAEDSRHRQAGFNQLGRAELLEQVLERLDRAFPETDEAGG